MIQLTDIHVVGLAVFTATFIGLLLRMIHNLFSETIAATKKKVESLEENSQSQNKHILTLTEQVSRLSGEREGFVKGAEKVSADLIKAFNEVKNK